MTITPEEIARLRGLSEKATPGPWATEGTKYPCVASAGGGVYVLEVYERDAVLIVAARNALPALLDAYEAEKAARSAAEAQSLESSILAHAWMTRHDRINTWKEGGPYPKPADVPRSIARAEAAEARADRLAKALQGIVDDDDASTSLALQRSRWDARMSAARAALAEEPKT